jgi:hypothetical protein
MKPGRTMLLMGPPGSGKSSFALQVLESEGSGLVVLAPGLDEFASYQGLYGKDGYKIYGFDDPEFYPSAGSLVATGYDQLLGLLRGVNKTLSEEAKAGAEPKYKVLVTDTFNSMATLAMNKTLSHMGVDAPPPAMSPTGAAFWGYQRNLMEQLMRACRTIRGLGLHWVCTTHVAEKELKETSIANADRIEDAKAKVGIVPAISGGFRDVMAGGFDMVFHCGVQRNADKQPVYYIRWMGSDRRPTKVRGVYGKLAEGDKMRAHWPTLEAKLKELEANG